MNTNANNGYLCAPSLYQRPWFVDFNPLESGLERGDGESSTEEAPGKALPEAPLMSSFTSFACLDDGEEVATVSKLEAA